MNLIEEPIVHHLAQTTLDSEGVDQFLLYFGAADWETDAPSDAEELIELAGRRCYNSFESESHEVSQHNLNLTKVRKGNQKYIGNIIDVNHGAVIEHASDSYMISAVPRVFTHEQVRHRVGVAYSQESLRYVRMANLSICYPHVFQDLEEEEKKNKIHEVFSKTSEYLESAYAEMNDILFSDDNNYNFGYKKRLTSAMRYLMPMGLSTGILVTANHRTWRHTLELRTSRHAEDWIRHVYGIIARDLQSRYPNLYQDMKGQIVDGLMEYTFNKE